MSQVRAFTAAVVAGMYLAVSSLASAQNLVDPVAIHMIWMGGNDCPPCVYWRGHDLPILEKSAEFKTIKFSYVTKTIRSPIPAAMFLPPDVKPYREKLEVASAGRGGSPQAAILVNGVVFDYFRGTRSATEIEAMIFAIRTGGKYPFKRCVKLSADGGKCDVND